MLPPDDADATALRAYRQTLQRNLLERLADTPTPAGPTPRELAKVPALSAGATFDGTATRAPASDGGTKPPDDRPLSSPTPPPAVARQGQA